MQHKCLEPPAQIDGEKKYEYQVPTVLNRKNPILRTGLRQKALISDIAGIPDGIFRQIFLSVLPMEIWN